MRTILSLFLGIVLIVAGTAVLTYQGVTFTTAERELLNVGPLQAGTQQSNWTITLPPILGAILLAGGTTLVFLIAFLKRGPKHGLAEIEVHEEPSLTQPRAATEPEVK